MMLSPDRNIYFCGDKRI